MLEAILIQAVIDPQKSPLCALNDRLPLEKYNIKLTKKISISECNDVREPL